MPFNIVIQMKLSPPKKKSTMGLSNNAAFSFPERAQRPRCSDTLVLEHLLMQHFGFPQFVMYCSAYGLQAEKLFVFVRYFLPNIVLAYILSAYYLIISVDTNQHGRFGKHECECLTYLYP